MNFVHTIRGGIPPSHTRGSSEKTDARDHVKKKERKRKPREGVHEYECAETFPFY